MSDHQLCNCDGSAFNHGCPMHKTGIYNPGGLISAEDMLAVAPSLRVMPKRIIELPWGKRAAV